MKMLWGSCLVFGLWVAVGWAAEPSAATNELWFPVGEKLVYRLYWGVIPVGQAEITSEWTNRAGKAMVLLRARAQTTSVVAMIYPVDDNIESLVDPDGFLPVTYHQRLKEGRHERDDIITFDRGAGIARWESGIQSNRTGAIQIDGDTRDVLTLAYYMRGKGLSVGERRGFRVLVDNKIYDLDIGGVGTENLDVEGVGGVPCLRVEPKARFGAIFVRKGKVMLWFSTDSRRLCVKMTGKVPLASVRASLVQVGGAGADFWVRAFERDYGP